MLQISIDVSKLARNLTDLQSRHLPFATVVALTWTAKGARKLLYAEMRSKLDKPTQFTVPRIGSEDKDIGSMRVEPATKEKPFAVLKMKDFPAGGQRVATDPLLRHHFYGGARVAKGMELWFREKGLLNVGEYLVLGKDAPRDRYGNLGMANWNRMVSHLALTGGGLGYARDASMSKASIRHQRKAGMIFWSAGPKAKKLIDLATGIEYGFPGKPGRQNNLPKGVWVRNGMNLTCWFIVTRRTPTYQKRFDLEMVARRAVNEGFAKNFRAALKKAVATSGYKGKW